MQGPRYRRDGAAADPRCCTKPHQSLAQVPPQALWFDLRSEYSTSYSRGSLFAGDGGQTTDTASERRIIESAVLPSEIERLKDLSGYLKMPSLPHWLRVDLPRPE